MYIGCVNGKIVRKKKRARELNLASSISQVIFITAAFTYSASLQQFTMFYSCPPCSIYHLVSELFVKPDFYVFLRSPTICIKSNASANFIQFNLAVITCILLPDRPFVPIQRCYRIYDGHYRRAGISPSCAAPTSAAPGSQGIVARPSLIALTQRYGSHSFLP